MEHFYAKYEGPKLFEMRFLEIYFRAQRPTILPVKISFFFSSERGQRLKKCTGSELNTTTGRIKVYFYSSLFERRD